MVAVKKVIARQVFAMREAERLLQRYANITLCTKGSSAHKTHGLGDDKVLIKAWGKKKEADQD